MAKAPTTYVPNTTAQRTRKVDALSFPFAVRPQAMTAYVRFIELGTITCADNTKLMVIGSTGVGTFQIDVDVDPYVNYRIGASNQAAVVTKQFSSTVVPSIGNMVEIVAKWYANGAVAGEMSINGGTPSTTAVSGALTRTPSFSVAQVAVNSYGATLTGVTAIRDLLVLRGVHDLATMRKRVGIA